MAEDANQAAQTFEPNRRRLTGLAYRMIGSLADAEDIVQDAYLRWHATDRDKIADPRAYLSKAVARLCLDHLKSARVRRESYVGPMAARSYRGIGMHSFAAASTRDQHSTVSRKAVY